MFRYCNFNEISKIELEISTHKAKQKCFFCKETFFIFNLKNAKEQIHESLCNKLIYEEKNEKGIFEIIFNCECPFCENINKTILELKISTRKETLIFDCDVVKMPILKVLKDEK